MCSQEATNSKTAVVTCDVCGARPGFNVPLESASEFLRYFEQGGYSSIFGDGFDIRLDVCQSCVATILGPYLRVTDVDSQPSVSTMARVRHWNGSQRIQRIAWSSLDSEVDHWSIKCDCCGLDPKIYEYRRYERGEFMYVRLVSGANSIFGNGKLIESNICQHCVGELFGKVIRVSGRSPYDVVPAGRPWLHRELPRQNGPLTGASACDRDGGHLVASGRHDASRKRDA